MKPLLFCRDECLVAYTVWSFSCAIPCCNFSVLFEKKVREARIIFTQRCESNWDATQMRKLLYQDRSAHRHLDLR